MLGEESEAGVAVVWAFAIHSAFTRLPWPAKAPTCCLLHLHWSLAAWRYIPLPHVSSITITPTTPKPTLTSCILGFVTHLLRQETRFLL
jgi:hypothetical protein